MLRLQTCNSFLCPSSTFYQCLSMLIKTFIIYLQLSFILHLIKLRYNLLLVHEVYILVLKCSERTFILEKKPLIFLHIYLKKKIFNITEVVISDYFNIFCKKHKLTSFLNILLKKKLNIYLVKSIFNFSRQSFLCI